MDYVEAEGNSIDEAIERALEQLGVPREKAEIEIVSNATRGLFGLGGRRATVRATLRTTLSAEAVAAPVPSPTAAPGDATSAPRIEPAREVTAAAGGAALLATASSILQDLVRLMGSDAKVEAAQGPDGVCLTLVGDASGVLIGRRGQTLDALEYLVNRIVARDDDHAGRIVVDSQNYRDRRRQALELLARRSADRARRRGKTVTLNPMSPRDRRIIHLTLQNDRSLVTRSFGSGYFRKLLIIPEGAEQRAERRSRRQPREGE